MFSKSQWVQYLESSNWYECSGYCTFSDSSSYVLLVFKCCSLGYKIMHVLDGIQQNWRDLGPVVAGFIMFLLYVLKILSTGLIELINSLYIGASSRTGECTIMFLELFSHFQLLSMPSLLPIAGGQFSVCSIYSCSRWPDHPQWPWMKARQTC